MLDGFMKNKFYTKCKSQTKHAKSKIELIKKKRNAMQKYLKNDIADLLRNGLDVNAYGRAEGLLVELNLTSCYDLLEQFCLQILNNLSAMDNQRECPEECREAVSSLVFSAARMADLPELRDLRTIFSERYGNSMDCYVNKEFVERLKLAPPTKDMRLKLMQDIATESGLNWNAMNMEPKLYSSPAYGRHLSDDRIHDEFNTHEMADNEVHMPFKEAQVDRPGRECQQKDATRNVPELPHPPSYNKSEVEPAEPNGHLEQKDKHSQDGSVSESKPKPKSVRRNRKPALDGESGIDKKYAERGRKEDRNQPDEEEKAIDMLLIHYSQKKSPNDSGKSESVLKPPPQRDAVDSGRGTRWRSWDACSTPESTNTSESIKGHSRASSFQPETSNQEGRAHPKLPDYDDFVARLAAFKGGN